MRRAPAASLLLLALVAGACGGSAPSSGAGATAGMSSAPSVAGSESAAPASSEPVGSSQPPETPTPSALETATPGASASGAPTDSASPPATPSPTDAVSACQPAGSNPNFWPGIAASVSWDVYCAVLPKGWSVESGKYRLAGGGWLTISYKGPGGATLSLSEGSFCTDGGGCVPSGSDAGDASFGAMPGSLIATDAGGFAVVVAKGQTPSWLMVTGGLDQATTTSLGAALALVH